MSNKCKKCNGTGRDSGCIGGRQGESGYISQDRDYSWDEECKECKGKGVVL